MRKKTARGLGLGILLGVFLAPDWAFSQAEAYFQSALFPILFQGFGPRATAMGNSFSAAADDASALYFNPAGLAEMDHSEILAAGNSRLSQGFAGTLGVVQPLPGSGTLGFSLQYLNFGSLQGTIGAEDFSAGAAFAFAPAKGLDFGIREQWFRQTVYGARQGLAVDVGILAHPLDRFYFGLDLKNLGFESGPDPLPLQLLSGISLRLGGDPGERHTLTASLGESLVFPDALNLNGGLEFGFLKRYFLRVGYDLKILQAPLDFPEGLAFGTGIISGDLRLDGSVFSIGSRGDIFQVSLTWFIPSSGSNTESTQNAPKPEEAAPKTLKAEEKTSPVVLNFEVTEASGLPPDQLFEQGLEKEKLGLDDEAAEFYLKAVDRDPGFQKAWARLGRLYLDKSRRSYRKALELDPANGDLRKTLERLAP